MTTATATARDTSCFVCGGQPHADWFDQGNRDSHNYWSTADAFAEARAEDARMVVRSKEAAYVDQHRPY